MCLAFQFINSKSNDSVLLLYLVGASFWCWSCQRHRLIFSIVRLPLQYFTMSRFAIPALWSNIIAIFGINRTGRWAASFQHLWKDKTLLCSATSRCDSVVESTRLLKLIDRDLSRSILFGWKVMAKKTQIN